MKNFRVFNGTVQNIVAERCEVTPLKVVFSLSEMMIKSYNLSEVRMVEELDCGLRTHKVLFPKAPAQPDGMVDRQQEAREFPQD